jgi:hypothetical protein
MMDPKRTASAEMARDPKLNRLGKGFEKILQGSVGRLGMGHTKEVRTTFDQNEAAAIGGSIGDLFTMGRRKVGVGGTVQHQGWSSNPVQLGRDLVAVDNCAE